MANPVPAIAMAAVRFYVSGRSTDGVISISSCVGIADRPVNAHQDNEAEERYGPPKRALT